MGIRHMAEQVLRPTDPSNWRANIWEVLITHQKKNGEPPRFCVHDHMDHIHMVFRCGCPNNCPTRNYRIDCTVEQICDVVPRENMHIHENEPVEKPASPEAIASLPVLTCEQQQKEENGCAVCCNGYSRGEEMIQLPCEHLFHRECIMEWLKRQNTCPTCRYELPSVHKKKSTVMVGEAAEGSPIAPPAQAEQESSVLGDFLGLGNEEENEIEHHQQKVESSRDELEVDLERIASC